MILVQNPVTILVFHKDSKNDSSGISSLRHNGVLISENNIKTEDLNYQFKPVFTKEDINVTMPNLGKGFPSMPNIEISVNGIEKLLTDLKSDKATGPDNVPGRILKMGAS